MIEARVLEIEQGEKCSAENSAGQDDLFLAYAVTDRGRIWVPAINFPVAAETAVRAGDILEIDDVVVKCVRNGSPVIFFGVWPITDLENEQHDG